jgi:TolA-binding protein
MERNTAFTLLQQDLTEDQLLSIRERIEADPENLALLDWAAYSFYSSGEVETAAEYYRRLVREYPASPNYHYYLGNCLYQLEDLEAAATHWRRVVSLDPAGEFAGRAMRKLSSVGP